MSDARAFAAKTSAVAASTPTQSKTQADVQRKPGSRREALLGANDHVPGDAFGALEYRRAEPRFARDFTSVPSQAGGAASRLTTRRDIDRFVAARLAAPPFPKPVAPAPLMQRKCACADASEPCATCGAKATLARMPAEGGASTAVPSLVNRVLGSPGQPLDPEARSFFEPRFGSDFSGVRVHADGIAAESARAVNALAYTVGSHVAFASGRYQTKTEAGRKLLAHELAHVVQQGGVASSSPMPATIDAGDSPLERDADRMANAALEGYVVPATNVQGSVLSRQTAGSPLPRDAPPDASPQASQRGEKLEGVAGKSGDEKTATRGPATLEGPAAPSLGLSPEKVQAAAEEVTARVEGAADRGKAETLQVAKQLQWGTLDVAIDESLLKSKDINRELAIRFFQVVLKRLGVELEYWMAERIHARLAWKNLSTDEHTREAVSTRLAAGARVVGYESNNDSVSAVANAYFDILREDQERLRRAYEELHKVHYAEDAILSFYIAHVNGVISVANGLLDLPVAPVNLVQSIRGKERYRFLGRIPKIDYVGDYGKKYGGAMETGVVLGLMLVGARGGGGPTLGLSSAKGSAALAEGASTAAPWLTRLLGGAKTAGPIIKVATRLLGVAGVSAGAQAGVDTVKAVNALRTGQITKEDGTVEPLTEDKAFELLEAILVNILVAKQTAKGLLGSKKAPGKEAPSEKEGPPEKEPPGDEKKAEDERKHAPPDAAPVAILPDGTPLPPDHFGGGYHGTDVPPDVALKTGLPARGNNWRLQDHAEGAADSAFRGTTQIPSDPVGESGAANWADEGGYVYKIEGVPTWDVNKALQGRVRTPGGTFRGNLMHGENESAIPARVPPEKITRWGIVKRDSRGRLFVDWQDDK